MGRDLRAATSVLAAKLTASACRLFGRGGGTTFPGAIARRIDPGLLRKVVTPRDGVVLVTGTNGKTTTTGLIVSALEHSGRTVLTNASGSNIMDGLIAATIAGVTATGQCTADIAVFEVDELWMEQAVIALRPQVVVVLNFLRDQLDRSGELETTALRVGQALRRLPEGARIIANVDDPIVWAQCEGLPGVVPVGIHSADARTCPRCDEPLDFDRVILAHCGSYRCPTGDFARPQPALSVKRLQAPGLNFLRLWMSDSVEIEVSIGGAYNAYNAVVAYATCRTLGVAPATIRDGLRDFQPKFGRQERITLHGQEMQMLLAKNPAGFDEVLRTSDELGDARVYLIAINDGIADGRDVSWLWDVDFERLARTSRSPLIVASGRRAADLAVRLKYAGVPAERISVEPRAAAALQLVAQLGKAGDARMILPTYTAMLELRAVAERAGAVEPFWRTRSQALAS
jgi:UDP-N-acetylmuramyl tripeptide synthase